MIKKNIAVELRLYPNKEQQELLAKTFGCCRKVYNLALAESIESYKQNGKFEHRWYTSYKEEFPFLGEVEAQALNQSLQNLKTAFKNRFSKTAKRQTGFPKFKSKHGKQSYRTCQPSAMLYKTNILNYLSLVKLDLKQSQEFKIIGS